MSDPIVTTTKSLAMFGRLARAWFENRGEIKILVHYSTWSQLVALRVIETDLGGPEVASRIEGILTEQDPRVPAGVLRIVYVGGEWDLPVDVEAMKPGTSDPAGGICEVEVRCWACSWRHFPAEGSRPGDALASANFFAQEHRSSTGHGVTVEVKVNWTGRSAS